MCKPTASHWIASCAACLNERCCTVPVSQVGGAAVESWREEKLASYGLISQQCAGSTLGDD